MQNLVFWDFVRPENLIDFLIIKNLLLCQVNRRKLGNWVKFEVVFSVDPFFRKYPEFILSVVW